MVQYHRYHPQWRKGDKRMEEDEESQALIMECGSSGCYIKRTRPKLISLLFLSLLCCCFILAPHLFCPGSTLPLFCKSFFSLMGCAVLSFGLLSFPLFSLFCWKYWCVFLVCADSFGVEQESPVANTVANTPLCSSISNGWYSLSRFFFAFLGILYYYFPAGSSFEQYRHTGKGVDHVRINPLNLHLVGEKNSEKN